MTTDKTTESIREPYDAMGPVDAPNPPAARATLADVQPGGRVRLEDQAERARFEEWVATQHDQGSEHVMATVSATDDRYQSPVTSSMWSAWQAANSAREGGRINGWRVIDGVRVYSAYAHASILDDQQYVRYEDYLAALSAQPSQPSSLDLEAMLAACVPGGDMADPQVIADNIRHWFSAQPSPGGQGDVLVTDEMVDAACRAYFDTAEDSVAVDHTCMEAALKAALASRQPVGESVAWMHTHKATGRVEFGLSPMYDCDFNAEKWDSVALYAAPPAQAVDLGELREMLVGWKNSDYPFSYEGQCAQRALDACVADLQGWLDSQAVANG